MSLWEDFRMPAAALRNHFLWGFGALLAGLFVPIIQGIEISAAIYAFAVVAIAIAATITFLISRRRVWVAMSDQGVRGRGAFGRKIVIPWSERVSILPQPLKGVAGVRYGRVDEDGIPTLSGAVFIPYAILESAEFQRAAARLAPANHPLRGSSKSAT